MKTIHKLNILGAGLLLTMATQLSAIGTISLQLSASNPTDTLINITASGVGTLTGTGGSWSTDAKTINNFAGDPFTDQYAGNVRDATSAGITATAPGRQTITLTHLTPNHDGGAGTDDFYVQWSAEPDFQIGDIITFSGTATVDFSTRGGTKAGLNDGTYSGAGVSSNWPTNFDSSDLTSLLVISSAAAVPEPSTYALLLGMLMLGFIAHFRKQNA